MARALWLSSEALALADLVHSLAHIYYHPGIVKQALGCSAETAVSPHHNYLSTIYNDSAYIQVKVNRNRSKKLWKLETNFNDSPKIKARRLQEDKKPNKV
jgi:hypothetical protein